MASEAALGRRYEAAIAKIQRELDDIFAKLELEPMPFKVTGRNKKIARINTLNNIANNLAAVNGAMPKKRKRAKPLKKVEPKAASPEPKG